MRKKENVVKAIVQQGFLPLYFHPDEKTSIEILQTLYQSGIRVVEYTNRGKQALRNFRSLVKESYSQFPDLILGLGTVLDYKTAGKAIQNGAEFLVSPGYSRELAKFSDNENILWIPGCMTPTEIITVYDNLIPLIKLFPANGLGPGFLKSLTEVFPDLLFMPTGGVNFANIESWFGAGAAAVGIGSGLISKSILDTGDWYQLKANTSALIQLIAAFRNP